MKQSQELIQGDLSSKHYDLTCNYGRKGFIGLTPGRIFTFSDHPSSELFSLVVENDVAVAAVVVVAEVVGADEVRADAAVVVVVVSGRVDVEDELVFVQVVVGLRLLGRSQERAVELLAFKRPVAKPEII